MVAVLWPVAASAQTPAPLSPPSDALVIATPPIDTNELARVRRGLSVESSLTLGTGLRFHTDAESGLLTEYVEVPDAPFAGGGMDIIGLIGRGFAKWQAARREAEARKVRAEIERELIAIHGGPPPPPEGLIYAPRPNWTLERPKVPGHP